MFSSTVLGFYFSILVYLKIYENNKTYHMNIHYVLQHYIMRFIFEYNEIIRVYITIIVL